MMEVKDGTVGYRGRYEIRNINLRFEPGVIYTIVGKNGSGKSTLLQNCAGRKAPRTGKVLLDGTDLYQYSPRERERQISWLDRTGETGHIKVKQLVAGSAFPHRWPGTLKSGEWNRIFHALGEMKVAGLAEYAVGELSGGERQRVALAMQLVRQTRVLVMDGPEDQLDEEQRHSLMKQLKKQTEGGKILILGMHDLPLAMEYSDRIIAVDAGKEIYTGTPGEIRYDRILEKIFRSR